MLAANKYFSGYRLVLAVIVAVILLWSAMCNTGKTKTAVVHYNGKAFAGSESCEGCHHAIYASHVKTAHYNTSRPADTANVKGSFASGRNIFVLNDTLKAIMYHTDSGLFQAAYARENEVIRKRMDITVGSGRKGQTYLYWSGNTLFQLPVSYYAPGDEWCNSPGYPTDKLLFTRNVPGECIECHGTFLKGQKDLLNKMEYDRSSLIYGVDCERCHGPAAEHVAFHNSHPAERKANYIINPASLSRQQQLDNCALCHSGRRSNTFPSFSYITGDKLDQYSAAIYINDSIAPLDVHGNQYGLLTASRCFKMSKTLNCSTCHNVHENQSGDIEGFSRKCANCHNGNAAPFCPKVVHSGPEAARNCIDCHMPALPSKKIFLEVSAKKDPLPALIRTHLIARYSDQKLAEIKRLIRNFNQ